jgi:hypothetical protein
LVVGQSLFTWIHGLNHHSCVLVIGGQLWSVATTSLQISLKVQMNTTLFAKTLLRKDIASSSSSSKPEDISSEAPVTIETQATPALRALDDDSTPRDDDNDDEDDSAKIGAKSDEEDFSSKSQIMTLMTTDVDRIADFSWHAFTLVDAPIEIVIGTYYLYHLLGWLFVSEPQGWNRRMSL